MVVLRYFADLSEAQTAQALDCSLGTVKSTTSRAIDRLRAVLDAQAAAPSKDERAIRETDAASNDNQTILEADPASTNDGGGEDA
jgi:hypothetical protein